MRTKNPDRPPAGAMPLARALRELSGGPRMVKDLEALERQLAPLMPGFAEGDWESIRAAGPIRQELITTDQWLTEKCIRRLRDGELESWGRADSVAGPWFFLPAALWYRIEVLDRALGEVGQWLPTDEVRHLFYDVRIALAKPTRKPRHCAAARLQQALKAADAVRPLTLRDAEKIGTDLGASRGAIRAVWRDLRPAELRRPGRRRK